MASPKKPPGDDPLSRLLSDVGKQVESRLKHWAAKQNGGKGTTTHSAGSVSPPASSTAPKRSPGFGNDESVLQPITPPSPISTGDPGWDTKVVSKWVWRAIFVFLPILGVIKYIRSEKWKRNTDFQEFNDINGYINALSGALGDIMNGLLGSIVPLAIFIVGIILVAKSIRVVPQQRALVIERLGRFHAVIEPNRPFMMSPSAPDSALM